MRRYKNLWEFIGLPFSSNFDPVWTTGHMWPLLIWSIRPFFDRLRMGAPWQRPGGAMGLSVLEHRSFNEDKRLLQLNSTPWRPLKLITKQTSKSPINKRKGSAKQPSSATKSDSLSSDDSAISQYWVRSWRQKYTLLIKDCKQKIGITTANIEDYQEETENLLQKIATKTRP